MLLAMSKLGRWWRSGSRTPAARRAGRGAVVAGVGACALTWLAADDGPALRGEAPSPAPEEAERTIPLYLPIHSGQWVEPELPRSRWPLRSSPSRRYSLLSLLVPAAQSQEAQSETLARGPELLPPGASTKAEPLASISREPSELPQLSPTAEFFQPVSSLPALRAQQHLAKAQPTAASPRAPEVPKPRERAAVEQSDTPPAARSNPATRPEPTRPAPPDDHPAVAHAHDHVGLSPGVAAVPPYINRGAANRLRPLALARPAAAEPNEVFEHLAELWKALEDNRAEQELFLDDEQLPIGLPNVIGRALTANGSDPPVELPAAAVATQGETPGSANGTATPSDGPKTPGIAAAAAGGGAPEPPPGFDHPPAQVLAHASGLPQVAPTVAPFETAELPLDFASTSPLLVTVFSIVPEPSTALLLGLGLAGLAINGGRRRR